MLEAIHAGSVLRVRASAAHRVGGRVNDGLNVVLAEVNRQPMAADGAVAVTHDEQLI